MKTWKTWVASSVVAFAIAPALASATPVSFIYTDAADGNLVANFTLDIENGLALSGTGTITGANLNGVDTVTLLTAGSTLPAGSGQITSVSGNTFTWQAVPSSGGANLTGNNVASGSGPFVDSMGIILAISNPAANNAIVGGLNIWSNGGSSYGDGLAGGDINSFVQYNGTGTLAVSAVPLPGSVPLMACGLGALALLARRRAQAGDAAV